jgi:hypothetical protein
MHDMVQRFSKCNFVTRVIGRCKHRNAHRHIAEQAQPKQRSQFKNVESVNALLINYRFQNLARYRRCPLHHF